MIFYKAFCESPQVDRGPQHWACAVTAQLVFLAQEVGRALSFTSERLVDEIKRAPETHEPVPGLTM